MRVTTAGERRIEETVGEQGEFVPYEAFVRIVRLWWVVVLAAVLGGLIGLIIHQFRPPIYEAQATFMASIDFNKIDFMHPPAPTPAPYQLTQYDEDISLVVVEASLRQVVPQVVDYARTIGLPLDANSLLDQTTIERENAYWLLRFRAKDAVQAQQVVNYWADLGYTDLQAKQKSGKIPAYIYFELVQKADLPGRPRYFQTNVFVLAGTVIGLLAGIVLASLPLFRVKKSS